MKRAGERGSTGSKDRLWGVLGFPSAFLPKSRQLLLSFTFILKANYRGCFGCFQKVCFYLKFCFLDFAIVDVDNFPISIAAVVDYKACRG